MADSVSTRMPGVIIPPVSDHLVAECAAALAASSGTDALQVLERQLGTLGLAEAIDRYNADADYQARLRVARPHRERNLIDAFRGYGNPADDQLADKLTAALLRASIAEPFPGQIGGAA